MSVNLYIFNPERVRGGGFIELDVEAGICQDQRRTGRDGLKGKD